MTKYLSKYIFIIFFFLSSCSSLLTVKERRIKADEVAINRNFEKHLVNGGDFTLTTYQKITNPQDDYVFYLEGDGTIVYNNIITNDPTPRETMLLNLATIDERSNVVYIARPCQYTEIENNDTCKNSKYWTSHRMSEEVIASVNEVINKISVNHKISLIGFSGGGGVAILVAARNPNVKNIITIAGNLDHVAFTENLNLTNTMFGSLNPIDYIEFTKHIPQIHLSGGMDKRVPSFIAKKFVQTSNSTKIIHKIYKDNSHMKGWDKIWHEIYDFDKNFDIMSKNI
jgi:predicted esterase